MKIIFVSAFVSGKNERVIMVDVRIITKIAKGLIFANRGFVKCFPSLSPFRFVNTSNTGSILNFTFQSSAHPATYAIRVFKSLL